MNQKEWSRTELEEIAMFEPAQVPPRQECHSPNFAQRSLEAEPLACSHEPAKRRALASRVREQTTDKRALDF